MSALLLAMTHLVLSQDAQVFVPGTITLEQMESEDPPPYGQIGRIVVGAVGFGGCKNPGLMARQLAERPTKPSDPWIGVDHDVPAALPLDTWQWSKSSVLLRKDVTGCDAAHDHCFRDCTWLVRDVQEPSGRQFTVWAGHRRADGVFTMPSGTHQVRYAISPAKASNVGNTFDPGFVAYRTVPATKRLLAVGRLVAVQESVPENEVDALSEWTMGTVLKLDFEAGTVQLKGSKDTFPLAATRVVVLTSKDGGPVELPAGLGKTDIVVGGKEVFLPK